MNSHFESVALAHASRLINHGPTVLISTSYQGKRNIMAAAWSMPVEFTPPRISVVIDKRTLTKEWISETGIFGLIVPGFEMADITYAVGSQSGRDVDKFERFALQANAGPALGVPVLEAGCAAWMECRLIPEDHTEQAYDTCFAEVVSAAADSRIFSRGRWTPSEHNRSIQSIHHLGGGLFASSAGLVQARPI